MPDYDNEPPIALFDLDETLAAYRKTLQDDYDKIASPEEEDRSLEPHDDLPEWKLNRVRLIRKVPGWWTNLPKLRDGFEILKMAREIGYGIHILTQGPESTPSAWTEKVIWCQHNLGLNISITVTQEKSNYYGKVLVDDYPGYVKKWLHWHKRGLVIMPHREQNKDYDHPNVIRYRGPEDRVVAMTALQWAFAREPGKPLDLSDLKGEGV